MSIKGGQIPLFFVLSTFKIKYTSNKRERLRSGEKKIKTVKNINKPVEH
jgi:hypothetical protein